MKNKILLAGVAALALTATNANAVTDLGAGDTPLSVQIHPQVDLVGSFGLQSISELKFGIIVVDGDMSGKSITVNRDGTAYGNVTLLGGSLNDGTTNPAADAGTSTVAPGVLKITGDIPTLLASRPSIAADPEHNIEAVAGASVTLNFLGEGKQAAGTIDLVDAATSTVCGTVSNIDYGTINAGGTEGINYSYGGQLVLSADAAAGMHCVGNATVTMVFNE